MSEEAEVWYRRFFEVKYLLCLIVVFIAVAWWLFDMVIAGVAAQLSAALVLATGMTLSKEEIETYQCLNMLDRQRPRYRTFGPSDVPKSKRGMGSTIGTGHVLRLHRNGWIGILLILVGVALQLIGKVSEMG